MDEMYVYVRSYESEYSKDILVNLPTDDETAKKYNSYMITDAEGLPFDKPYEMSLVDLNTYAKKTKEENFNKAVFQLCFDEQMNMADAIDLYDSEEYLVITADDHFDLGKEIVAMTGIPENARDFINWKYVNDYAESTFDFYDEDGEIDEDAVRETEESLVTHALSGEDQKMFDLFFDYDKYGYDLSFSFASGDGVYVEFY